jgi:hypothetical protein
MFDPASITAALGSVKAILDLLKSAKDVKLATQISSEVGTLQGKLIEVQQQTLLLQKENHDLRDEVRNMKRAAEEEQSFHFEHGVYWKTSVGYAQDDEYEAIHGTKPKEVLWHGPFCPLCKDDKGKAVCLKDRGERIGTNWVWYCELHGTVYPAPPMQS